MIDDSRFKKSHEGRAEDTDSITLAAFQGESKPNSLLQIIHSINDYLLTELRDLPCLYNPYSDTQIHAPLCRMEETRCPDSQIMLENMSRSADKGSTNSTFDLERLLDFFAFESWPLVIQFGGYQEIDFNPLDRERRPWKRSFELRPDGLAVLMGWTFAGESQLFAPLLLGLRRQAEAFGLAHRYHVNPRGQDNDLLLVIGSLDYKAWKSRSEQEKADITIRLLDLQRSIRTSMAARPIRVPLAKEDISIITHKRPTLETVEYRKDTTEANADEVQSLYAQR